MTITEYKPNMVLSTKEYDVIGSAPHPARRGR